MTGELASFADLLERERIAAIAADTVGLLAIQEQKQLLVGKLVGCDVSPQDASALRSKARANIALLRHLVNTLRGMLQIEDAGYTANGGRQSTAPAAMQVRSRL